MDFKEFVNKLEQDLKEALSDISLGAQVRQTAVEKLQAGSYTGISITPADTNIGMNLNADQLFAQMQLDSNEHGASTVLITNAMMEQYGVTKEQLHARIREGRDVMPMGVADMNFATVPTIMEEMIRRAQHPLFGYFTPSDEYYDSIIRWHETRNHVEGLTAECVGYENGVLGGVLSALGVLCSKGDSVLVHSPTYLGFTMSLQGNGYNMVLSPLVKDADGVWRMDYEDMERKIVQNNIHAALFCTPHNPTGRVWEAEELEKMMDLFVKHDVYIVSDKIWSDLILPGHHHIPLQIVNEEARNRTIAIYAPSKTFNIAGLVGSYNIVNNKRLRDRVNKEKSLSHYNEMNIMSVWP